MFVCPEASEDSSRHFKLPHWGQIFSEDSRAMLESRKILALASVSALSTKRLTSYIPFCLCVDTEPDCSVSELWEQEGFRLAHTPGL